MSDIQRMSGTFDPPEMDGQFAVLAGVCPVSEMRDYAMDVNVYTHGTGRGCVFDGYRPCHNAAEVIEQAGYDPGDDLENTPDFGVLRAWRRLHGQMVPGAGFHASGSRIRRRAVTSSPGKKPGGSDSDIRHT